jgi:hypothetical protein
MTAKKIMVFFFKAVLSRFAKLNISKEKKKLSKFCFYVPRCSETMLTGETRFHPEFVYPPDATADPLDKKHMVDTLDY